MNPRIRIYVATHKKLLNPPKKGSIYIPVAGGAALRDCNWGYQRDDEQINNLSKRNLNFCELGTMYWAWKNGPDCDITGLLHYRRWFVNENNKPLSEKEIIDIMNNYDAVVNGSPTVEFSSQGKENSIYNSYCSCHHGKDIDWFDHIVKRRYPNDWYEWHKWMYDQGNDCITNMIITRKEIFDEYCAWIFPVFFEMDQEINIDEYDDYNKRIYGFMGERIMYPWLMMKKLKVLGGQCGDNGNDDEKNDFDHHDDFMEHNDNMEDDMEHPD